MVLTSFVARYSPHSSVTASLHSFCGDEIDCIGLETTRAVLHRETRSGIRQLARLRLDCTARAHTFLTSNCSRRFRALISSTGTLWHKMSNSASRVLLAKGSSDSNHCLQSIETWVRFKKSDGDDSRMGVNGDMILMSSRTLMGDEYEYVSDENRC